jgi:hypothetical protein
MDALPERISHYAIHKLAYRYKYCIYLVKCIYYVGLIYKSFDLINTHIATTDYYC